jgi:hypothetical protein
MSDDDLRFRDVSGASDSQAAVSSGVDMFPIVVAGLTVVILLVTQPLSTDMGGVSMNYIGALVVAAGGLLAGFDS